MVRIAGSVAILLAVAALVNIVYHVIRKPTELFVLVGNALDKEPAENWRQYGPLFRTYSTATITPELLAALAQVESSGNPVARAGPGCLDSAPLDLSGFLPGYAERGALRFCRCVGRA
ncbi:hypothetical protein ACVIJW_000780 [Bradyrhizobium barranii subsp. barranii]